MTSSDLHHVFTISRQFHDNQISGLPGDAGKDGEKGPPGSSGLTGNPGDMGMPGNVPHNTNCVILKRKIWEDLTDS